MIMGLFSMIFGNTEYSKADCDHRIADLQQKIANLQYEVTRAKSAIAYDKAYNKQAGRQVIGYSAIENQLIGYKGRIAQYKAEIAKWRSIKSSLKK